MITPHCIRILHNICVCSKDEEINGGSTAGARHAHAKKTQTSLPSHQYIISRAGLMRYHIAGHMMSLRNPDAFAMHTFNDHMPYGALEVVQNLLLDFDEAYKDKQLREALAVVEAMALFVERAEGDMMCMADDGEMIQMTMVQIARMVLTALGALERNGHLLDDSASKNLNWVMALYMQMASTMRQQGLLENTRPSKAKTFKFRADNLDLYLRSYAHRFAVTVPSVDVSKNANIAMPKPDAKDPWNWARGFADYPEGMCRALLCLPWDA